MRRIVITIFTLLSGMMLLKAETPYPELYLRLGGGLSGLTYDATNGSHQLGFGMQAGAGMTFFFHRNWGILAGAEWSSYRTDAKLNDGIRTSQAMNNYGTPFEWRVDPVGYQEKQTAYTVNIPIALQFQWPVTEMTDVYVLGGMKFGIPLSSTFNVSAATVTTSGYYPLADVEVTGLPAEGFGVRSAMKGNSDLRLQLSYTAMAEAGLKFNLSGVMYLYAGVYIDYGLNNINDNDPQSNLLPYYSSPVMHIDDYKLEHSVISVNSIVDKVRLMSFGVNIRISFPLSPPDRNRILTRPRPSRQSYNCRCGQ